MLINGINYPHQLLEAIKNNNLVLFAGAGVSIPEPTHMPSFIDLAKIIGANCHKSYVIKTDDGKEKVVDEVDVFLGDLERQNKPIKKKV